MKDHLNKIVLVCVNYQTDQDTRIFVKQVRNICHRLHSPLEIIIANNSARSKEDSSFSDLVDTHTHVVNLPENLGYFNGAEAAWQWYINQKQPNTWPIAIVSNVDIEFSDPEFFYNLEGFQFPADLGVIAPSIISGLSHQDCNPYMLKRPHRWRMHFYKWIFGFYWSCQLYQILGLLKAVMKSKFQLYKSPKVGGNKMDTLKKPDSPIYAAHGCMMIFTPPYFMAGGNFKHGAFLYNEEIKVGEFCRLHNLRIDYEPQFKAYHREHGSTGLLYSKRTIGFIGDSSRHVADTYFS